MGLHKKGATAAAKGLRRCWSLVQRIQNCVRSSARGECSLEYKRRPAERGHREHAKKRAALVPRQAILQKRVHKAGAARALISGATTAVVEKPNDLEKPGVYMTWGRAGAHPSAVQIARHTGQPRGRRCGGLQM